MKGWSKKVYLELPKPSEEDHRPLQVRLTAALEDSGPFRLEEKTGYIRMRPAALRDAQSICDESGYRVTATAGFDGRGWELLGLEAGDTVKEHYGLCVDLGSTTVLMELVDLNTGEILGKAGMFNPQINWGEDILSRIFYTKDQPEHRKRLQKATAEGFCALMEQLREKTGIDTRSCPIMTVSGNTTMIHFLLGLDAFEVFQSPYAVQTLAPDICRAEELGISMNGFVYCCPGLENYLGGDIISGMLATGIPDQEEICVFLDVGTNGELVVGNKDFLLAGAGAAGPALEGGVVHTGMRAEAGAVDRVTTEKGKLKVHVIGEGAARGICGSGIADLIAELYLNGWIDLRGKFQEDVPEVVRVPGREDEESELAVEYAPGLYFYQDDIDEFLKTKAAAMTMVEYMMNLIGLTLEDVGRFYVAGAFGTHFDKESAVTIGLYPDIDREKIISPGNTSLQGAEKLLLDRSLAGRAREIIERMEYVQFGAVEDFIHLMAAATAIPHTDLQRYPSVVRRLEERRKNK